MKNYVIAFQILAVIFVGLSILHYTTGYGINVVYGAVVFFILAITHNSRRSQLRLGQQLTQHDKKAFDILSKGWQEYDRTEHFHPESRKKAEEFWSLYYMRSNITFIVAILIGIAVSFANLYWAWFALIGYLACEISVRLGAILVKSLWSFLLRHQAQA